MYCSDKITTPICQRLKSMKRVISASRRTDLVAFFPEWLSSVLDAETARIYGPSGHTYSVDLVPQRVHTVVLWSKNFSKLIQNAYHLRDLLQKYDQPYFHFTITGISGHLKEIGTLLPKLWV